MKLVRYGAAGEEKPGMLDKDGQVRALHPFVSDIDALMLSPAGQQFLRAIDPSALPLVASPGRMGVPVNGIRQIIAIGLNYAGHAKEGGFPIPEYPVVFHKSISSLSGANDPIVMPRHSVQTDWEIELGVVIGSTASQVSEETALQHVAGYCIGNDVSERDWQRNRGGTWGKGKSFDSFTPVGPWLVTADEIPDPQQLELTLSVNGERKQSGNTSDMIFSVAQIISHLSEFMTLFPGDLILTGTPAGVGFGRKPQQFLALNDVVDMSITNMGTQRHLVTE